MATATLTGQNAQPQSADQNGAGMPSWLARLIVRPLEALKHVVYPPLCLACDADLDEASEDFCPSCLTDMIATNEAACPRCARRVGPFTDTSNGCPECRGEALRYDAAIRLGIYAGKLREMCLSFKSVHNELLGPALTRLFLNYQGAALRAAEADMVVAVPLHFIRHFQRGFNQAESLARHLARELKVPHYSRILKRIRRTKPQSELKREKRRDNVHGAFKARRVAALQGATVLLVDDILTTGATCSEAARALKAAGAARVVVAVIARSQEQAGGQSIS